MQPNKVASTSALPNCFKCDELRHRMVDCRKGEQYGKGLFDEFGVSMDEVLLDMEKGLEFDVEEEIEEELLVQGDEGTLLVAWRACFTPCKIEGEDFLAFKSLIIPTA
jgi:hypothetical protein